MSARPPAWRTALLLLLMLGVLSCAGWVGVQQLTSPLTVTTTPCDSTTVVGSLESTMVTVTVYNTGSRRGLATGLMTQLKGKGFNVIGARNSDQIIVSTTIVGGAAYAPEVLLVAGFFPDSVTESDGRVDHTVDVFVNDDFTEFDEQASTSIDVASAVICTPTGQVTASQFPVNTGGPNTSSPTATPSATPTGTKAPSTSKTKT